MVLGMKPFLRTFLIWLLLLFTFQILFMYWMRHPHESGPLFYPGRGWSEPVQVYIFQDGDKITVRDHVVTNGSSPNPIGKYRFIIQERYYPVAFYYELISKQELDIILNYAVSIPGHRERLQLSGTQLHNLNSALHSNATNHPVLSKLKPGGPPTYRIAWNRIWFSLIIFTAFGVASGFCMYGFQDTRRKLKNAKNERRVKCGLCINCAYPIAGLPSPDCPECGQSHSSMTESPA